MWWIVIYVGCGWWQWWGPRSSQYFLSVVFLAIAQSENITGRCFIFYFSLLHATAWVSSPLPGGERLIWMGCQRWQSVLSRCRTAARGLLRAPPGWRWIPQRRSARWQLSVLLAFCVPDFIFLIANWFKVFRVSAVLLLSTSELKS